MNTDETTESLTGRLAEAGAELLNEHLVGLLSGELKPAPQRGKVIETRKIEKEHGAIDWSRSAEQIERHVRAMWPWPRAWTAGSGEVRLQIHEAEIAADGAAAEPGTVLGHDNRGILVATCHGVLRLLIVQVAGKTAQPAVHLAPHPALAPGNRLGLPEGYVEPAPWIVEAGEAQGAGT